MDIDACYQLGRIIKPHGLNGEMQVILEVDQPQAYEQLESVFVELRGQLVPFFIESLRLQSNKTLMALEEVHTLEDAEGFRSAKMYLPLEVLPKLTGDTQFYYHEIVDYAVEDLELGLIGTVKGVYDMGPQSLMGVAPKDGGEEILVPIVEPIVQRIDREKNTLFVQLPEGLLDLS